MSRPQGRISARFAALKAQGRGALMPFLEAWDPDGPTSMALLRGMPAAGADLIEIGMPFTDPMADGPIIQAAGKRALLAGAKVRFVLDMVREFRREDDTTPIVLMGYLNPILSYGVEKFCVDSAEAGVDGMIVVDLPPEEDDEFCIPALKAGLHFIRLATPTTDEKRLPAVLEHTSGFIYYVSIAGITGAASADNTAVAAAVARLRAKTTLPVAVGFGIKTPAMAAEIARIADAAVVGSALVQIVADSLDADGRPTQDTSAKALRFVRQLADGVRGARKPTGAPSMSKTA